MSEHSRPHLMDCPACIEESDAWASSARFRAGMTAMARFCVFVTMEAAWREAGCTRAAILAWFIESGRLALRWNDE